MVFWKVMGFFLHSDFLKVEEKQMLPQNLIRILDPRDKMLRVKVTVPGFIPCISSQKKCLLWAHPDSSQSFTREKKTQDKSHFVWVLMCELEPTAPLGPSAPYCYSRLTDVSSMSGAIGSKFCTLQSSQRTSEEQHPPFPSRSVNKVVTSATVSWGHCSALQS